MRARWMFAAMLLAMGCGESEDGFETRHYEAARSGGWSPPADILAKADTFDIANVQAGVWTGPSGCGGTFQPGTRVFRDWIRDYWPQVGNIGGYSCRKIANSSYMSVHATGRALDVAIAVDSSRPRDASADNDAGDPLANYMLANADKFGIQQIIWDNKIWTSNRPPGSRFRTYTNTHKHHDHIHVELNPAGAQQRTPWFDGPMGPPDLGPCGDPLPADGGIIDNEDDCFRAMGPAQFWRTETGVGHGGSLRWTNAFEADEPSNWARWEIELAEAGRYRVEYHSVSEWAVYDSARYRVRHDGVEEDVHIDLGAGDDGWQLIGEFDFAEGRDQWVSVYDDSPVAVADGQHVIADAIRLRPPLPVEPIEPELDNPPVVVEDDAPVVEVPASTQAPPSEPELDEDRVVHATGGCATPSAPANGWLLLFALAFVRLRSGRS